MGKTLLTTAEFVAAAKEFKEQLKSATCFEEIRALWRNTSLPYHGPAQDPFSSQYKDQVLGLYTALCDSPYEVQNEMVSVLQTAEDFRIGYPWITGNFEVVAIEVGKAVQAFRAFNNHAPQARDFIEFGSGWANLAIPLARSGKHVTAVDIDAGFLARMMDEAKGLDLPISPIEGDFLEAAKGVKRRYDVAVFSSSFHHCLDFSELLTAIREHVLKPEGGRIFFFAEPISDNFAFPWGLRYDGESLWAITCNKWLELGFSGSFFRAALDRAGFDVEHFDDSAGCMGDFWVASQK